LAPKDKAVQGKSEANILPLALSKEFEPRKIQYGSIVENSAMGPMIAANFAFEKNAATKKENPIIALENRANSASKYHWDE
jgi:hypothetical protein